MRHSVICAAVLASCAMTTLAKAEETAFALRDLGLAQLENDQPEKAEATFYRLTQLRPREALSWADLGIARLRQQKVDAALDAFDHGLKIAPGRPELLGLRALGLEWQGDRQQALATTRSAARAAPEAINLQFQLLRQAEGMAGDAAEGARREALNRLSHLRPENLVVLLRRADQAVGSGDRADATAAILRVRELLWQAPPAAMPLLGRFMDALEADDMQAARVPLAQLTNVLKTTPMYRESMKELNAGGALGRPIRHFDHEPPSAEFGHGIDVRFTASRVSGQSVGEGGLAVGDFDGDGKEDVAVLDRSGRTAILWGGSPGEPVRAAVATDPRARLAAADLDDDGRSELIEYGQATRVLRWGEDRSVETPDTRFSVPADTRTLVPVDYDIEGDLDLAGGGPGGPMLWRNALQGSLESVSDRVFPRRTWPSVLQVLPTDLDRDGDLDLVLVTDRGLLILDNLRQGRFTVRAVGGPAAPSAIRCAVSADFDNDGWPDVAVAGDGIALLHNDHGRLVAWPLAQNLRTSARFDVVVALDADYDGRMDLALAGPRSAVVLLQRAGMRFDFAPLQSLPEGTSALIAADVDGDGDLDLVAGGSAGLYQILNDGGNRNHWLAVRLHGLTDGSSKNNAQGIGSVLEVRSGRAYQFREVQRPVTRFGLGRQATAPVLRVVWTNGVPQNRLDVGADQLLVEEQVLKGSCPFLYTWNGRSVRFVTDLLWNTMLGMPLGRDRWAPPVSTDELVRVDGAALHDGAWDLRITSELWEAFFFDRVRLWVVDHPRDVEVASNLRVLSPGTQIPPRVMATRDIRALAAAVSGQGHDLTDLLAARDDRYAHAFEPSRYQGVADRPWSMILDLGAAPGRSVRLLLDGWLYPPDASLNVAVSQRSDIQNVLPRIDVETADGWRPLMETMGLPAGKIKEMVVDTPPLPPGAHRLRIVSSWWIAFDRIRWSTSPADDEIRVAARLAPDVADLHFRGFSALVHGSPWGSHTFDYAEVSTRSPWLPFPGRYTRYGDVRELLDSTDDRSVIVGPGDEIALRFDHDGLPAVPQGWRRTVFLESEGWGKDADRNTLLAEHNGPLPWQGMTRYPPEPRPDGAAARAWRAWQQKWLTRVVEPGPSATQ